MRRVRRIRQEDGDRRFREALERRIAEAGHEEVDQGKGYFVTLIGPEGQPGERLIREWWRVCGYPPMKELIYDEDYDFDDQLARVTRHWCARLGAARALFELAQEGYIEAEGNSLATERVQQAATDVTPESGGGWGGSVHGTEIWDVQYPARVKRGPFAKQWDRPEASIESLRSRRPTVSSPGHAVGVIVDSRIREEAFKALGDLENDLRALVDSGNLSDASKRLIEDQAYELIDKLRSILRRVTENERERQGWLKDAIATSGSLLGTLSGVAKVAAPVTGVLASAPAAIANGVRITESILAAL